MRSAPNKQDITEGYTDVPSAGKALLVLIVPCKCNAYRSHKGKSKDRPRSQGLVIAQRAVQGWKCQKFFALWECGLRVSLLFVFPEMSSWGQCSIRNGTERTQRLYWNDKKLLDLGISFRLSTAGLQFESKSLPRWGDTPPTPDLQRWFHLCFARAQVATLLRVEIWPYIIITFPSHSFYPKSLLFQAVVPEKLESRHSHFMYSIPFFSLTFFPHSVKSEHEL